MQEHSSCLRRIYKQLRGKKKKKDKGKGQRERYTQLNEEFQRIARRLKKALDKQCKEIEENNRIRKTRGLF